MKHVVRILLLLLCVCVTAPACYADANKQVRLPFSDMTVPWGMKKGTLFGGWVKSNPASGEPMRSDESPYVAGMSSPLFTVTGLDGRPADVFPVGNGIGVALQGRFKRPNGSWGPWLDRANDVTHDSGYAWKRGDIPVFQIAAELVVIDPGVNHGGDLNYSIAGYYDFWGG